MTPAATRTGWIWDVAIIIVLAAAWGVFAGVITDWQPAVMYDTFRDMAWAENMLDGRFGQDPTIPGQVYWYAPGSPLLFAALAAATGYTVAGLYASSVYWLNGLLPILLYLLARLVWDRLTALLALPLVFLGSYWWLTHALAAMPSIQGVVLNLAGLLCWQRCTQNTHWSWAVVTGAVLAASVWHHPLCGIVLAGAVFLHAVGGAACLHRGAREHRWRLVGRMLIVAAVSAVLTGPLVVHELSLKHVNPDPLGYFAAELTEPLFYAHWHTPLVIPLAAVGVWFVWRGTGRAWWLIAYLLVSLAGQAAGYLHHFRQWPIPHALPHEFQWHGQLALGVCAAVGAVGLGRALARRSAPSGKVALVGTLGAIGLCLASAGPAVRCIPRAGAYLINVNDVRAAAPEAVAWIRHNTTLDATFACYPDIGYFVVAGLTGRKCVAVSPGHMNPEVDAQQRWDDLRRLMTTADEAEFIQLAQRYGATHLLLTRPAPADSALRRDWSDALEPVFEAQDHSAKIYAIRPPA